MFSPVLCFSSLPEAHGGDIPPNLEIVGPVAIDELEQDQRMLDEYLEYQRQIENENKQTPRHLYTFKHSMQMQYSKLENDPHFNRFITYFRLDITKLMVYTSVSELSICIPREDQF